MGIKRRSVFPRRKRASDAEKAILGKVDRISDVLTRDDPRLVWEDDAELDYLTAD